MDGIIDLVNMSVSKLWEIVKDREPGVLQSMGLQRVRDTWQLNDNSEDLQRKFKNFLF